MSEKYLEDYGLNFDEDISVNEATDYEDLERNLKSTKQKNSNTSYPEFFYLVRDAHKINL